MCSKFIAADGPYQYSGLETTATIRVLKIHPDLFNDEIACMLQHVHKDELPEKPYSALSYYWGDRKHTRTIFLGNASDNPGLPVKLHKQGLHENLWEFLDQMRCQMKQTGEAASFLWTDFLCLNQKDKGEVSEQVARMGEIYSSAKRTISWLGRPDRSSSPDTPGSATGTGTVSCDLTELQMDWIPEWVADKQKQALIKKYDLLSLPWHDLKTRVAFLKRESLKREEPREYRSFVGKAFIPLINILSLPYWTRIWIVQEIALAKRVDLMFGSKTVDFDQFVLVYKGYFSHLLYTRGSILEAHSSMKPAVEARERLADGNMPLWEVLHWAGRLESSERVDRVYGFLGLLKTSANRETQKINDLKVDYERNVSQVYWDVAFGCIFPPLKDQLGSFRHHVVDMDPYALRWERFKLVSYYRQEVESISLYLGLLRKSLLCSSDLLTLQTFVESARPPPSTQQLMASVALRLATACRAVGRLCESTQLFLGPESRPAWIDSWLQVPLWQMLLETYLQVDKNDGLGGPDRRQAAAIGVLMEADKRLANDFGLGRWACLAHTDARSRFESAQKGKSTIRFEAKGWTAGAPQCCRPRCSPNLDSSMTQKECISSQRVLDLPEIGSVLTYEDEERGESGKPAGVICIQFDKLD